jgi:hypothetical protein
MRVLLRAWAVFAALTLASSWAAAASTVYVDDNSPCPGAGTIGNPYCRIQDAICAIRSTGGGTVMVKPGTYNEAVRMFFGVSVVSTDGPLVTTINPTSPALKPCITSTCTVSTTTPCAAVYFPSSSGGGGSTNADRLEGFRITGGRGIRQTCGGTCDAQAGGGLFILNSSPTITRNTISGNVLDPNNAATNIVFRGAGIYVGSSMGTPARPVISLNTIEGNIADSAAGTNSRPNFTCGAGIYVDENSAPRIEANLVRNNRSGLASKAFQYAGGGGIAVYTNTSVALPRTVVTRNQIAGNQAADGGGGVSAAFLYTYPSNARIENNLIEQNTSDDGGGIATLESAAEIVNNTITDNTAAGGAGISFGNAPHALNLAKLSNNLITFNIASMSAGGAFLHPNLNPVIKENDFHGNTPTQVAGAKTDAQVIGVNGNINANPNYVSRVAGNRNLRLQPGSVAIDNGINADAGGNDLDNTARVKDGDFNGSAVVDMGAFEVGSADFDGDGNPDATDPDDDNDGVGDAQDCAPRDATASRTPTEVAALNVSKAGGTQLTWTAQGAGFRYDVAGGGLATLRTAGNVGSATCLANDLVTATWTDARPNPASGQGYYYLSRAQNACGTAGYGAATSGTPRVPAVNCP